MDAGDWIALGGTLLMVVFQSIGVALFLGHLASQVKNNTKEIESLERTKATTEGANSRQLQIEELKRHQAECDGRIAAMRAEYDSRFERAASRTAAAEQSYAAQNSALSSALTEIRATMAAMKEAIDRLSESERQRHAPAPLSPIDQLRQFVELQKLMKQVA